MCGYFWKSNETSPEKMNKLFVVLVVCVAVFAMSATFALAANPVAAPVDAAQPESFKPFCEVCVVIGRSFSSSQIIILSDALINSNFS